MSKGFGIHGSTTSHGGTVISTQSRSSQMGNLFLRAGDGFACPKCKTWSTLIKSNDHVIFDGKAVAYVGDRFTCGATLMPKQVHVVGISGSSLGSSLISNFKPTTSQQNNSFLSENNNFDIELTKTNIKNGLFVPCGVPFYENKKSNDKIDFEIKIKKGIFEYLKLELETEPGKYQLIKRISGPHHPGKKITVDWDGFVNDVYESKKFTSKDGVNFRVKGYAFDKEQCSHTKNIKFEYKNKDWIDIVINKKSLKVDVTLRINIKDSGDFGIHTSWRRIPELAIKRSGKPPIKTRILTFDQLKKIALEGMNYYWSRNNSHPVGKSVLINGQEYQFTVNCINATASHMPSMPIIFASNWSPGRSCNWELSRKTYYNIGYIEFQKFSGNSNNSTWEYWDKPLADNMFKHTFSHEMGHEILLAYGGQMYSKKHKGSSSVLQSPVEGTKYPRTGEIDLMKYADESERRYDLKLFYERSVAAAEDVASLIHISGLDLK